MNQREYTETMLGILYDGAVHVMHDYYMVYSNGVKKIYNVKTKIEYIDDVKYFKRFFNINAVIVVFNTDVTWMLYGDKEEPVVLDESYLYAYSHWDMDFLFSKHTGRQRVTLAIINRKEHKVIFERPCTLVKPDYRAECVIIHLLTKENVIINKYGGTVIDEEYFTFMKKKDEEKENENSESLSE